MKVIFYDVRRNELRRAEFELGEHVHVPMGALTMQVFVMTTGEPVTYEITTKDSPTA